MTVEPNNPSSYSQPLPNPRPTSVTVLAIIGIVFGAWGVLCDLVGLAPFFIQIGPPNPMLDVIKGSLAAFVWVIFASLVGWALSILLLISSIASLRLRPWARGGMLIYAGCKLVLQLAALVAFVAISLPLFRPLLGSSDPTLRLGAISGLVSGAISVVLGSIYPIFLLVCLRKPHVVEAFAQRGQQTASGPDAPGL